MKLLHFHAAHRAVARAAEWPQVVDRVRAAHGRRYDMAAFEVLLRHLTAAAEAWANALLVPNPDVPDCHADCSREAPPPSRLFC